MITKKQLVEMIQDLPEDYVIKCKNSCENGLPEYRDTFDVDDVSFVFNDETKEITLTLV